MGDFQCAHEVIIHQRRIIAEHAIQRRPGVNINSGKGFARLEVNSHNMIPQQVNYSDCCSDRTRSSGKGEFTYPYKTIGSFRIK